MDWFFSDDDLDDLSRLSVNLSLPADTSEIETTTSNNHNLLLNNIQKVEGTISNIFWCFSDDCWSFINIHVHLRLYVFNVTANETGVREMASAKDIVSSIISAANRKIQRRRKCQDETDNESHEVDKVWFHVRNMTVVDSSVRACVLSPIYIRLS